MKMNMPELITRDKKMLEEGTITNTLVMVIIVVTIPHPLGRRDNGIQKWILTITSTANFGPTPTVTCEGKNPVDLVAYLVIIVVNSIIYSPNADMIIELNVVYVKNMDIKHACVNMINSNYLIICLRLNI